MKKLFSVLFASIIGIWAMAEGGNHHKHKTVNNTEFAKIIAQSDVQLIDVRTPIEYRQGHIPGAVNMDVKSSDFEEYVSTLSKKKIVALYCRSGARSKIAAEKLTKRGFKVVELSKGIIGWDGEQVN